MDLLVLWSLSEQQCNPGCSPAALLAVCPDIIFIKPDPDLICFLLGMGRTQVVCGPASVCPDAWETRLVGSMVCRYVAVDVVETQRYPILH